MPEEQEQDHEPLTLTRHNIHDAAVAYSDTVIANFPKDMPIRKSTCRLMGIDSYMAGYEKAITDMQLILNGYMVIPEGENPCT
jgi:hypothetical protein